MQPPQGGPRAPLRPDHVRPVGLAEIAGFIGLAADSCPDVSVTGISLNSRAIRPGDLYLALPGAQRHGAEFADQAVAAGAVAVLTDDDGGRRLGAAGRAGGPGVPVLVVDAPRKVAGAVAGFIYGSGTEADSESMRLFAVTGTNGKTTTTYFINSLLQALGRSTGLIGTIEILAGSTAIPSLLTTPESTDVHALLALMRERGLQAASMEVSSHALAYGRVDGVVFDVAGFTNLTQDHLDLHGTMEEYFATKAGLFTSARARRAVVTVDDSWGRRMAQASGIPTTTLCTIASGTPAGAATADAEDTEPCAADWQVTDIEPAGLGNRFVLQASDGRRLRVSTGLPGAFNVANAALAALMVLEGLGAEDPSALEAIQSALDRQDPFTVQVPGRMQLVGRRPAAIVDFAHNPDALERALLAVRPAEPKGKVIVVFGATGQRDATKRPAMGAVAAKLADVVIITDDDPHDEDPAGIRAQVLDGARRASQEGSLERQLLEVFPRADAIFRAVELAGPEDTILVAGRGHEVWQEVAGVNLPLDDRVELRRALDHFGFTPEPVPGIES
ncbi:MAG TPA: UDP-N-acetylmuramoyl-L-alanyl-D-glutamate--2,6-diaminopimelate ligase [Micrococcaceae bacterium]|nr:UDP-N-acetylmuramoyl-L-alanyl-D-glutamate--2,6-diaminopimelate ligase [Micrococcaceae bacterium]